MNCNCEDILNKELCDVPYEWRSQIVKSICSLRDHDYECDKSCQTITFLSQFRNENNQICISYLDEKGEKFDRCFDYDLTETLLDNLIVPNCVPLPTGFSFKDLSFTEKFQHIVDLLCKSCCGTPAPNCNIGTVTSIVGGTTTTSTSSTSTSTSTSSTTTSTTTSGGNNPSARCGLGMDVVFLVDYNFASSPDIQSLKLEMNNIISAIQFVSQNNYRLGLVIVDEGLSSSPGPYYNNPSFTAPLWTATPASQKYTSSGSTNGTSIKQRITALEKMSNNNKISFSSKFNELFTFTFPSGEGASHPQPTDIGLELVGTTNIPNWNYIAGQFRSNVEKIVILLTNTYPGGRNQNLQEATIKINNIIKPAFLNQQIKFILLSSDTLLAQAQNPLYSLATQTGGSSYFSPVQGAALPVNANNSGKNAYNAILQLCSTPPGTNIPGFASVTTTTTSFPRCCVWENLSGAPVTGLTFTLCNPCCINLVNFTALTGDRFAVVEGTEQGANWSLMTKRPQSSCFDLSCTSCCGMC